MMQPEITPTLFEAAVPRCPGYEIKVSLRPANEWNATPHVDLRIWTSREGRAEWTRAVAGSPTRKGFTVPIEHAEAFVAALHQAIAAARDANLLEG